jgi:hypothetical protein
MEILHSRAWGWVAGWPWETLRELVYYSVLSLVVAMCSGRPVSM